MTSSEVIAQLVADFVIAVGSRYPVPLCAASGGWCSISPRCWMF